MNVAVRPAPVDILSICTGGGGLDLGIGLAVPGARAVCMVEREAFAVAHLVSAMEQGLLAPAPVWSDARTFDGRRWRGCVDGLIGGIPCQPHSLAGRKQGSLDARDLWSDARRIIVQSRPWFVLIENVAGMLTAGADEIAGAERVWRDLRKLGFAVEIGLFTAAEVGASHERKRVFILGVSVVGLADAFLERSEGSAKRDAYHAPGWDDAEPRNRRCPGLRGGEALAHADVAIGECASRQRHGSGNRTASGGQRPCGEPSGPSHPLVHAERAEWGSDTLGEHQPDRHHGGWDKATGGAGESSPLVVDAERFGGERWRDASDLECPGSALEGEAQKRERCGETADDTVARDRGHPLFPPPPDALSSWAGVLARVPQLEPAIRRMADGMASRVDVLRLLGNGVVPLQAAHAFRTLCARLAGRGHAGAARLVQMMGARPA